MRRLIAVPHGTGQFAFNYGDSFRKELALVFSRLYDSKDFEESVRLLAGQRVAVTPLISHRMSLSEGVEAIDLLRHHPDTAFKVLLRVAEAS